MVRVTSIEDREAGLRRLIDKEAIIDLYTRFAAALDACEWDALRRLFTEDAVLDWNIPAERWEGIDRIIEHVAEMNASHPGSHRMMTNHRVSFEADRARAVALYRSAHLDGPKPGPGEFYGKTHSHEGWYLSELRRTPEGWRFAYLRHETLTKADLGTPEGRKLIGEIADFVER
jgi:ketosteroid isomerase-like protein